MIKKMAFSIILISLLFSCGEKNIKYEIINQEKYGDGNIRLYVVYNDTIYTESVLRDVLLDVYKKNSQNSPTNIMVYLFTSLKVLEVGKSEWICMLDKNVSDPEPKISFNNFKTNGLQKLNDNEKSEDEIALEKLTDYLKERNLELCDLYKQLGDMELECIRKADKAYPNDGQKRKEYIDNLIHEEKNKLIEKYNLVDSVFVNVSVFGMIYCK